MAHVGLHHVQPVLPNELPHQLDALLVGCHLRSQVGQVVVQVPSSAAAGNLAWSPQGLSHRWTEEVTTETPEPPGSLAPRSTPALPPLGTVWGTPCWPFTGSPPAPSHLLNLLLPTLQPPKVPQTRTGSFACDLIGAGGSGGWQGLLPQQTLPPSLILPAPGPRHLPPPHHLPHTPCPFWPSLPSSMTLPQSHCPMGCGSLNHCEGGLSLPRVPPNKSGSPRDRGTASLPSLRYSTPLGPGHCVLCHAPAHVPPMILAPCPLLPAPQPRGQPGLGHSGCVTAACSSVALPSTLPTPCALTLGCPPRLPGPCRLHQLCLPLPLCPGPHCKPCPDFHVAALCPPVVGASLQPLVVQT